jgi:thiamine biosynthesis lipoprotein ApbE
MPAAAVTQASGREAAASWRAIGTSVHLLVTEPRALGPARRLLGADLAALDAACSRFRADSEIVALDHAPQDGSGRTRPVRVSPLLAGALAVALRVQDVTGRPEEPPAGPSAVIAIRSGGLATSSTAARRWRRGGDVLHHILDPRSGRPAAPVWRTVSVAAATCADANTASTAAIIRGAAALAWLAELGCPARLVAESGAVVTLGGWPPDQPSAT